FNNMLSVITNYSALAAMKLEAGEPAPSIGSCLTEIRQAAERSAGITRQLLAFARKQILAPVLLDLGDTIGGMLKMLQRLIGEDIDISWQTEEGLWTVKVDPAQIDQILANLFTNARDAISGVGRVTIETGNIVLGKVYCAAHGGAVPGEYVRLAVSDTGCGMEKEVQAQIFEPFFTTKGVGRGTGLGLPTVYGIVKQSNGYIEVRSEPGKGTTFTIYFPRHAAEPGEKGLEVSFLPVHGHETILLVEDEPAILESTALILEMQGYTVLMASTPDNAIRLAEEQKGEIHLLLTDVVMPEMNGQELARKLVVLYPHLKQLFMSGYSGESIANQRVLVEGVHFIEKPFSLYGLIAKVREALDSN
ncbi:MAG: ATP-binding protein, partial [Deltaproteobacteria bacterium]